MVKYLLLVAAVLWLAWANGANDMFKGVATLHGSGVASYRRSLVWAAVCMVVGAILSLYLATGLITAFSGKGFLGSEAAGDPVVLLMIAAGAAATVSLATVLGLPTSTTHALVGAMAGAGLATLGSPNWTGLGRYFLLPLLLSPALAVATAWAFNRAGSWLGRYVCLGLDCCLCLRRGGLQTADVSSGAVPMEASTEFEWVLDTAERCETFTHGSYVGTGMEVPVRLLHYVSAGSVCMARALNDTPKLAAFLVLLQPLVGSQQSLGVVAIAMLGGGLMNAARVAETMSRKIARLERGSGVVANVTTAVLVTVASLCALPVSTTHVACGAIAGSGLAAEGLDRKTVGRIIAAWFITLPLAAIVTLILLILRLR